MIRRVALIALILPAMVVCDATPPVGRATRIMAVAPAEEFRQEGLRFGAHNIHENQPVPTSWRSDRYVVGTYFNGGVRIHDITDPFRPEEVASYIPAVPPGAPGVQTNDVYVDENEVIYAVDRIGGGLYILALEL